MEDTIEKRMELLAPAGNPKALDAALNAGADAVYVGTRQFSARRGAANFTIEELKESVRKAHLRDAKLYVAFNTIIADEELPEAGRVLADIYRAGVDAVIVQDWGVFGLIKETLPDLSIHTSTQMNTHNSEMVRFIKHRGAKRVTLARELSVEEISEISSSTDIEVECFIHGALCFSYSGQCLFSSMVGNRSGNRGLCPQACRLEYDLIAGAYDIEKGTKIKRYKSGNKTENIYSYEGKGLLPTPGKHIMSASDLCGIKLIPDLAGAGVSALKIEGRMKSPEYVAIVVDIYRRALDRYYADPDRYEASKNEIEELCEVFNRGFTEGYLSGIKDNRMMSFARPSDRGVFIGRVTYLDVYKGRFGIELKTDINKGDEVEVWVSRGGRIRLKAKDIFVNGKRVKLASAGSKADIPVSDQRHKIHSGDRVFRVSNERIDQKAKDIIKGSAAKRIPIEIRAVIAIGEPIKLKAKILDERNPESSLEANIKSEFLAEAGERRMLNEDDVKAQFDRLGNTVYKIDSWNIEVEPGAMVPLGKLNELRRSMTDMLDATRLESTVEPKILTEQAAKRIITFLNELPNKGTTEKTNNKEIINKKRLHKKPVITVDVSTLEQAVRAAINGADWIYLKQGFKCLKSSCLISEILACENNKDENNHSINSTISELKLAHGVKVALAPGNIIHNFEMDTIVRFVENNESIFDALLIDNFGMINAISDNKEISNKLTDMRYMPLFVDHHLNVFNSLSAELLENNKASRISLSTELTLEQISGIVAYLQKRNGRTETEAIVHGWLEVMTSEHCIPSAHKESCSFCKEQSFIIEDKKGFRFPVEQDMGCRSHVYNSNQLYLLPNISSIVDTGVSSIRLMLNRYAPEDVGKATSLYREGVDLVWSGSNDLSSVLVRASKELPGLKRSTTGHFFRKLQ